MQYALGTDATTAPANNLYTTSIPTATNAGTYYVWYKAVGDSNHTDAEAAFVEVTVAKGAIEANVTGYTGTYDGEAHGITVSVAVPQSDSQTEITIKYGTTEGEYTLSESPAFTNVSENSYTIYYEITAENYETMTGSETVTINPKEVTVTADAKSKTYGEAEPELTYTSSGLVGEDKLTGKLTREAGENAGTYAIQQGTLTAGDNYTISYTGADLTIEKAASEITKAPEANVLTYNGKEQALVTLGEAAGGTIRYALGESAAIEPAAEAYTDTVPATKYSGTYYIWYKVAGDENHLDTQAQSVAVTVEPVLFGDVNFDGIVDIADALMISRYDAELTELNEKQLFAGDVDGDGEVNIADALMISRYDAGLLDKFTRTE